MSNFAFAVQDSVDEVRKGVSVRDREIWFSFLNPMSSSCLLVRCEHVKFFKKCVLVSLLPSLVLAAIGAFYSLKNGASREIELFISLPVLLSYMVILFAYIRTERKSERLNLDYKPFVKIAKGLAVRMETKDLIKSLAVMGGFALALFIGSLVIYERGFYLVALIIFTLVGFSLSPVLLVLTALIKRQKTK
ncbi:hypothetical protein PSECIP111854_02751 [Pseudoalteromonas sp. CIP111854]|uniref:Uncharacterized protein n=1 Tax=Pseudoalteromonas holothuriae TaxID=2963714 RepID=A0A9W4W5D0_9GAMM|nr:hypothetical protein [Pseudoalteromonas sp. CIP111854]CAH9061163.1 hypothetical protein PSECIP111854_02751 [Pseudoalteromonas sp. CIP111854]